MRKKGRRAADAKGNLRKAREQDPRTERRECRIRERRVEVRIELNLRVTVRER